MDQIKNIADLLNEIFQSNVLKAEDLVLSQVFKHNFVNYVTCFR